MNEWPGDDTPLPISFHAEPGASRTPLPAVTLCAFLAADSLERWVEIGITAWRDHIAPQQPGAIVSPWIPWLPTAVLWATVHGTLAALVGLRTPWARSLAAFILVAHIVYLGQVLAITQPGLWVYMSELGRARVLITTLIDAVALAWLLSPQARAYLDQE